MRRYFIFGSSGMAAVLAAAWLSAMPASARGDAADPSLLGLWMTEKKGVLIELFSCRSEVCGRVVWLAKPHRRSGEVRRDRHNPDPRLRNRLWCGSQVIEGLEDGGDGKLENGRFYYLGDGATYDLDLKPDGNDQMIARAYLGLKLLGKSETWTRPTPDMVPGCITEDRS